MLCKAQYTESIMKNQQRQDAQFANKNFAVEFSGDIYKPVKITDIEKNKQLNVDINLPRSAITNKKTNINSRTNSSARLNKNADKKLSAICEKMSISAIPYALYTYRKELKRSRLHIIRLSQYKVNLTDHLVNKTIYSCLSSGSKCPQNIANALTREMVYKSKLKKTIEHIAVHLKKKAEEKKKAPKKEKMQKEQ